VAAIDPAPDALPEADKEPPAQTAATAESTEAGELGATATQRTLAAEHSPSQQWIRDAFALRGLAFMLDRPAAAIRAEAAKLIKHLITFVISFVILVMLLAILFGFLFISGIWNTAWMVGQTDKITHHVNTWHGIVVDSMVVALIVVALIVVPIVLFVLYATFRTAWATVLEWSKLGNSMALMLGFVALAFFTSDSWHIAGAIPWWRLITLAVVFTIFASVVFYHQASRIVGDVLESSINARDVTSRVKDPLVKQMLKDPQIKEILARVAELPGNLAIPRRARWNLHCIVSALLARRIFISGIVVSAALFLIGIILIGQQDTLNLMNVTHSSAAMGFTQQFGIGRYQFFLSESLLKVSLLLGLIASAYFVFANPDPDQSQDLQVLRFVRKIIVVWTCYQDPALAGSAS